jgi:molybdopterin/thiamine biosynthesis adenylyltransferase
MKSLENINNREFSVAMSATLHGHLVNHLIRPDGLEDVAFALYKPSQGKGRFSSLIYKIILPEPNERRIQREHVDIMPEYFKRVCRIAAEEQSGLALSHSHPYPGWQGMSKDDLRAESGYAPTVLTLTDFPLVGLTIGSDETWSARIWEFRDHQFTKNWASTVRVVGKRLKVSYNDQRRPIPHFKEMFKRTRTFWGETNHAHIARLRVGIVGLGSVGAIVAQSLARMGIERTLYLDFDEVQEHNLDRLLGATADDIGELKVVVAAREAKKSATGDNLEISTFEYGITELEGYAHALDCDVLFSCVDRPWPRHVLNHIAYNHLIPVIDGGIKVRMDGTSGEFEGADWQLQTVGPDRTCLQCLGVYNSSHVNLEREGLLEDPAYMETLPADHDLKRNENIFPFSANLASLEIMHLIKIATGIIPSNFGPQRFTFNEGYIRLLEDKGCEQGCLFPECIGTGDSIIPAPIGFDHAATLARQRRTGR